MFSTFRATALAAIVAGLGLFIAGGARAADVTGEFNFQGTLSQAVDGGTSVTAQFVFDFTTDSVTSYQYSTAAEPNAVPCFSCLPAPATSFTSGGVNYLELSLTSKTDSGINLVFNPTLTEFFTQSLTQDGSSNTFQSNYDCAICSVSDSHVTFASGTITPAVAAAPEPASLALLAVGLAGLTMVVRLRRG
jgi:hypothetical protein